MKKVLSDRNKLYISSIVFLLILAGNIIGIYYLGNGSDGGSIIRNLVLAFYYMYYLGLGRWMNAGILILAVAILLLGLKKGTIHRKQWLFYSIGGLAVFYLSLFFWLSYMGGLEETRAELLLKLEFYIFFLYQMLSLGSYLRFSSLEGNSSAWQSDDKEGKRTALKPGETKKKLFGGLSVIFWVGLLGSLIPILAACRYIFPQSDDWSLGYKTHIAFEETGSFIAALGAAFSRVADAFVEHTGTYFTLLMMSIHPGAFKESWYAATPFIFVGLILFSTWFLFREICFKWLKMDRGIYLTLTAAYCILILQCMPSKVSAFYWYNGAVNYILPHSLLLCLLAFILRLYRGERRWYNYLGAGLTGICASGGNLVTVLGGIVLFIEIYFLITIFKQWKEQKVLLFPGLIFALGFAVNVAAPGNSRRISNYEEVGLVESFFQAFALSLKYMLNEWMHWSLFLFLALAIPILWTISEKIKASWRYPLLILFLGWGSLAGMFFAPIYATGQADAGRYFNVMYMSWVLWLMLDITYVFGWLRRKYQIQSMIKKPGRYYAIVLTVGILCLIPSIMAETEYYSASYAAKTILSGEAEAYARVYRKNIEILKSSTDTEVTLYELENEPLLFTSPDIEVWHSGIKTFYQKEKLNFIPWDETQ